MALLKHLNFMNAFSLKADSHIIKAADFLHMAKAESPFRTLRSFASQKIITPG
ncbi:hypothetical protein A2U01_0053833 [Trifolium medium]|uniref:Uncharacterized protein n=1 Tax=Trifolium medium TaxID=97028 RepID=A0A392R8Q0_9FABA|nr:hypothetical protein [Trifolium medium]